MMRMGKTYCRFFIMIEIVFDELLHFVLRIEYKPTIINVVYKINIDNMLNKSIGNKTIIK